MSQETLADQVVKTNEEKYLLTEKLEAANKVQLIIIMITPCSFVYLYMYIVPK